MFAKNYLCCRVGVDDSLMTIMLNNLTNRPTLIQTVSDASMANSELLSPASFAQADPVMVKHGYTCAVLCSQRLFDAPSAAKTFSQGIPVHSDSLRPASQRKRNSIMREIAGRAFVACLLLVRFPTAIALFIVSVIIRPSNGCFRERLESHILKKVLEGFQPSVADTDSSQTIMLELWVVRIVASSFHLRPACVFGRHLTVATTAMCNNAVVAPWITRGRLTCSHLTFHENDWVVRAESVMMDRLGSFYCIRQGRLVHYLA